MPAIAMLSWRTVFLSLQMGRRCSSGVFAAKTAKAMGIARARRSSSRRGGGGVRSAGRRRRRCFPLTITRVSDSPRING